MTVFEEFFPDSETIYHYTQTAPTQKWEDDKLSVFSFGIAAYEGAHLSDIILCRIEETTAWIELRDHNNEYLLTKAERQIRTIPNIRMIMIYTDYNEAMKQLYKNRGYQVSSMTIWDGNPKAYLMTKLIWD